jgi:hypothetical protein
MLNRPLGVTDTEFREITCSPELQEIWGVNDAEEREIAAHYHEYAHLFLDQALYACKSEHTH